MTDINKVFLIGRIVKDCETHDINGKTAVKISIAVNKSIKKGDKWESEVNFFDVVKYNAGGVSKFLTKGTQVAISGSLRQKKWERDGKMNYSIDINADSIQLLSSQTSDKQTKSNDGFDDDIPFR